MARCLQDAGWTVDVRPDGGISAAVPDGQDSAYKADKAECEKQFGYDRLPGSPTDDEIRDLYRKVIATAECIERNGVDPGDPPSEQTFFDQMRSGNGGWDPYSEIYVPGKMSDQEYFAMLQKCPRTWI